MPVSNFYEAVTVCCKESLKLWAIAGPIAFNILCNYGTNSFTDIFVKHIGDVEPSSTRASSSSSESSPFQDVPDEERLCFFSK